MLVGFSGHRRNAASDTPCVTASRLVGGTRTSSPETAEPPRPTQGAWQGLEAGSTSKHQLRQLGQQGLLQRNLFLSLDRCASRRGQALPQPVPAFPALLPTRRRPKSEVRGAQTRQTQTAQLKQSTESWLFRLRSTTDFLLAPTR